MAPDLMKPHCREERDVVIAPAPPELAEIRSEIDAVDDAIVAALGRRFALVRRVAEIKARLGLPVLAPARFEAVRNRAASAAADLGMSAEFAGAIYDLIHAEACRIEDGITEASGAGAASPLRKAR